jgi:energy-coupling factor transporter ATP-binding protein EcfA2
MAIKSININNFTVFSDFTMEFSEGINILIGENGVGKTHLMKLLYLGSMFKERGSDCQILSHMFGVAQDYLEANFNEFKFSVSQSGSAPVYIPSKEILMLAHAQGLLALKRMHGITIPFDHTLLDIIEKASALKQDTPSRLASCIAPKIESVINGVVVVKNDGSFWMRKKTGKEVPFSMETEGFKQFGLIWQLLMNGSIQENSVIIWDEPESSINPENIPVMADIILEMHRYGVQIILSTHSYNFARYFDILRKPEDALRYYSLHKTDDGSTTVSGSDAFVTLSPNPIEDAGERLYNDVIKKSLEAAQNG